MTLRFLSERENVSNISLRISYIFVSTYSPLLQLHPEKEIGSNQNFF